MKLPPPSQLELPLLEVLLEHGALSPARAADLVAEKIRLDPAVREARQPMPGYSSRGVNLFERRLRWTRHGHVKAGLVSDRERATWRLTEKGERFCQEAQPGMILTVFETDNGAALWAEFQTGLGLLVDGSVQACITSTPFPIVGGRDYGIFTPDQVVNLVEELFIGLKPKLRADGSVFLNLADVWERGRPTRSLYQERILLNLVERHGFFLADRFAWHSPTKPAATDWVTKRRVRVRSSMESFFWLSPSPNPKADNRNVLVPYGRTMQRALAAGGDRRASRPSGHGHAGASYTKDNGGAIPPNFFCATNAAGNTPYHRYCRTMKLPIHPARFPSGGILEFFVRLATAPGDLVVDLCAGSQQLNDVCERLGRQWFTTEKNLAFIRGGESYFRHLPSFHSFGIPAERRPVLPLP